MLKSFWRVEISEEGGVYSVEECKVKGTNGRRVIYVEALTKEEACSRAIAWHEKWHARFKKNKATLYAKRLSAGVCTRCGLNPLATTLVCSYCRDKMNARSRELAAGAPLLRVPLSKEEAFARDQKRRAERERLRGGVRGKIYRRILAKLDKEGAFGLRVWLVSELDKIGCAPADETAQAAE